MNLKNEKLFTFKIERSIGYRSPRRSTITLDNGIGKRSRTKCTFKRTQLGSNKYNPNV